MKYVPLIAVLALFAVTLYLQRRALQPRQSDFDAIEKYATANGLRVSKISIGGNHWRYWLRGHVLLSNVARTYVVDGTTHDGRRRELHVAIDPMSSGELKVLQEKSLSS